MRRLVLISLVAVFAIAACGSSSGANKATGGPSTATGGPNGPTATIANSGNADCAYWCGNGSATVTLKGATTTISGGGCYDGGSRGVDARFGDWLDATPPADSLIVIAHSSAGGTAAQSAMGSVGGTSFVLGGDTAATIGADGNGTFSGTDSLGAGQISGTFSCK